MDKADGKKNKVIDLVLGVEIDGGYIAEEKKGLRER